MQRLRARLPVLFPGVIFYTLPVDMVTQTLNFGLPAPIDVQVIGQNLEANRKVADQLLEKIRYVPGMTDLRIQQPFDTPNLLVNVDRTRAEDIGFSQGNVAQSLLIASSGSFQTSPTFFLDPRNGVSYSVTTQSPQYGLDSLNDLKNIPVTTGASPTADPPANPATEPGLVTPQSIGSHPVETVANFATIHPGAEVAEVSHYDIAPVVDIYGNVVNADLRSVSDRIAKIVDQQREHLPRGTKIEIRGQVQTMNSSFIGLLSGLAFSIVLVYLLIVVNFQSWLDPFLIIAALPTALCGIAWMLFITGTHVSVPALTGAIMTMGVATANSILVISFAREQLEANPGHARESALSAGYTRFRPVLMTALAMIIGMVPMALGLGDGGEQNAPLGRAVIGGLIFATVATLFFVPTFYSVVHERLERRRHAALLGEHIETD